MLYRLANGAAGTQPPRETGRRGRALLGPTAVMPMVMPANGGHCVQHFMRR